MTTVEIVSSSEQGSGGRQLTKHLLSNGWWITVCNRTSARHQHRCVLWRNAPGSGKPVVVASGSKPRQLLRVANEQATP